MKFRHVSKMMVCATAFSLSCLSVTACSSPGVQPDLKRTTGSDSAKGTKISVVAAEDFYGEVAKAVGGENVSVTSILNDPNADPHSYEPTPAAGKAVNNAQLVIYTGIGYDDWMSKLVSASANSSTKTVIAVGNDLLKKHTGDNPHVWYIPTTMPTLATSIADDLSKVDPTHAALYRQRAKDYVETLSPLKKLVQKLKQPAPTSIDVSEPVFDYMASALNLVPEDDKFAKAIEDGTEPTPTDMAKVEDDMRQKRVKFFVENTQTDDPTVKNIVKLAEENHIPIIRVTETEPTGKDYLRWMMDQLTPIDAAVK